MDMLAASLLLLPVVAAFALLYGPAVQASLSPGNEIMTASNYTFQSDTFSAAGSIGSVAGDPQDPAIVTGRWSLDVQGGVADFAASLAMVNASGLGYRTIELSNLTSATVTIDENGTALVTGVLDATVDGAKLEGVNATIALVRQSALNMTLSAPDYLAAPIYGVADREEKTTTASSSLMPEGNSLSGNTSEKFRLPQLPNPLG
jgi:hypothetical protein